MRGLAEYVMRGRKQAVLMVLLFNLIPFLGWISDVIMALITLRKGPKEGAIILMWAILPSVVFAIIGYPQLWIYNVFGGSLVVYLLAIVLRNTSTWAMVLYSAVLIGIVSVVVVHIYNPDIAIIWGKQLSSYMQTMKSQWSATLDMSHMQQVLPLLAKIGTGMQVVFILVADLISLLLARWWQSLLYNPGALRTELQSVRLGLMAVGILALFVVGSASSIEVMLDSVPVVLMPFALAGLSLLHCTIAMIKASKAWLIGFYGLWVLLFPYLTMLLVCIALIDSWLDVRRRIQLRNV